MNKHFFSGVLFHIALVSLVQDFYGKEQYTKIIEAAWVSPVLTVPLALILLVVSLVLAYASENKS
jgi:hypothetical protein